MSKDPSKAFFDADVIRSISKTIEGLGTESLRVIEKIIEQGRSSAAIAYVLAMLATHIAEKTPIPWAPEQNIAKHVIRFIPTDQEAPQDPVERSIWEKAFPFFAITPDEAAKTESTSERIVTTEIVRERPTMLDPVTATIIKTTLTAGMGIALAKEILEGIGTLVPSFGDKRSDDLMKPSATTIVEGNVDQSRNIPPLVPR